MIRKQAVLTVFLVSALFFTSILHADQVSLPDGALPQAKPIDKLLISRVLTRAPSDFEKGMAEAGWDIHNPQNLAFYNVRQIIARNEIESLQTTLDKKLNLAARSRFAVDTSA